MSHSENCAWSFVTRLRRVCVCACVCVCVRVCDLWALHMYFHMLIKHLECKMRQYMLMVSAGPSGVLVCVVFSQHVSVCLLLSKSTASLDNQTHKLTFTKHTYWHKPVIYIDAHILNARTMYVNRDISNGAPSSTTRGECGRISISTIIQRHILETDEVCYT